MHEIKYSDVIRGVLMFWALERSLKGRFWQYRINNLAVLACFLQLFVYYDTEGLHMPIVRNTICIRRTNRIFVQRVVQRFILWLRPDLQYVTTQATLYLFYTFHNLSRPIRRHQNGEKLERDKAAGSYGKFGTCYDRGW